MVIKKKIKRLTGENSIIVFLFHFKYHVTLSSLMVDCGRFKMTAKSLIVLSSRYKVYFLPLESGLVCDSLSQQSMSIRDTILVLGIQFKKTSSFCLGLLEP